MIKHGLDLYQKYESEIYKTANMKHPTTSETKSLDLEYLTKKFLEKENI